MLLGIVVISILGLQEMATNYRKLDLLEKQSSPGKHRRSPEYTSGKFNKSILYVFFSFECSSVLPKLRNYKY